MGKSLLQQVLHSVINQDHEQAEAKLHDYFVAKIKSLNETKLHEFYDAEKERDGSGEPADWKKKLKHQIDSETTPILIVYDEEYVAPESKDFAITTLTDAGYHQVKVVKPFGLQRYGKPCVYVYVKTGDKTKFLARDIISMYENEEAIELPEG